MDAKTEGLRVGDGSDAAVPPRAAIIVFLSRLLPAAAAAGADEVDALPPAAWVAVVPGNKRSDSGGRGNVDPRRLAGCVEPLLAIAALVVLLLVAVAVGMTELRRGPAREDMLIEPRRPGWISLRVCKNFSTCFC